MAGDKNEPGQLPKAFKKTYARTNEFAQDIADDPFRKYKGEGVVDTTDLQDRSYRMAENQIANGMGLNQLNSAMRMNNEAGRYNPDNVNNTNARLQRMKNVDIGQFAESQGEESQFADMDAAQMDPFRGARAADMDAAQMDPFRGARASDMDAARLHDFRGARAAEAEAAGIRRGSIDNVEARDFTDVNIGAYQNKYDNQVVKRGLDDLERSRQMQKENDKADAIAAKAFGGSREGVQRALTNESYQDKAADFIAQQRQAGFNTSAGMVQADADRNLQEQLANQGADLSVYGQNAGFNQQANLQNASQKQQNSQFNAAGQSQTDQARAQLNQQANQFNAQNQTANSQFNAGQRNQYAYQQAGLDQQASQFNAQNQTQNNQYNSGARNQYNFQQAGLDQQAGQFNAGAQQQNNQFNAQQGQQNNQFNAGALNDYRLNQANLDQARFQTDAGNANSMQQFNAGQDLQARLANQGAGLQANQQQLGAASQLAGMAGQQYQMGQGNTQMLNQLGTQQRDIGQQQESFNYQEFMRKQQDPYQKLGALQGATGSLTAPATVQSNKGQSSANMASKLSDERLKTNIVELGKDRRGRRVIEWEYLSDMGTRHVGYSAQDLLKSDPHAVKRHPFGFFTVDYSALEAA